MDFCIYLHLNRHFMAQLWIFCNSMYFFHSDTLVSVIKFMCQRNNFFSFTWFCWCLHWSTDLWHFMWFNAMKSISLSPRVFIETHIIQQKYLWNLLNLINDTTKIKLKLVLSHHCRFVNEFCSKMRDCWNEKGTLYYRQFEHFFLYRIMCQSNHS